MKESPKQTIRKKFREARNGLPAREILEKSKKIAKELFRLPEYKAAKSILYYVSFGSEVNTHEMIKTSLKKGKRVFVPITDLKKNCLHISEVIDPDLELAPSTFGILEPKKECIRPAEKNMLDLIVAPGIAFDSAFNRIGYGGGFYDGLFSEAGVRAVKAALCYKMQLTEGIPVKINDRKVDILVTETGVLRRS